LINHDDELLHLSNITKPQNIITIINGSAVLDVGNNDLDINKI